MRGKQSRIFRVLPKKEIKALFSVKNYNVPGPDGFTVNFYKANWYLVGKKFTKAIGHFFTKSFIYYPMNSTTISLIPKVETQLK